jgi:chemotaxis protein MotB
MAEKPTIVIKKIKKAGHGHHGGSWKVAYADFVTAMMAFFMLLWLLNAVPQEVLKGVADYFTPTMGLKDGLGIGVKGGVAELTKGIKRENSGTNASVNYGAPSSADVLDISKAKENEDGENLDRFQNNLQRAIESDPALQQYAENIIIDQTPDGLRIQLVDSKKRSMFIPGTGDLQPFSKDILMRVSSVIRYLPNYISVIGHTNSLGGIDESINLWKLSSDRADTARRFMNANHIDPAQTLQLVGKADRDLLVPDNPSAPENVRLEIILLRHSNQAYQKAFGKGAVDIGHSEGID